MMTVGALDNARDIAVYADAWGYRRIWVAEHYSASSGVKSRVEVRNRLFRRRQV
jgi:alkanesulfonate monooxygenase SsuD/methylene tetrahydromethanopterin reductase-like flavin-dependent oxidoreductase (luciferase family)